MSDRRLVYVIKGKPVEVVKAWNYEMEMLAEKVLSKPPGYPKGWASNLASELAKFND